MAEAGFDAALATADLVITGEGRIDAQTAFGKTALGVARRAQAAGVPCIAVGGGVTPEGVEALAARRRRGRPGERGPGFRGGRDRRRARAPGAAAASGWRGSWGSGLVDLVHRLVHHDAMDPVVVNIHEAKTHFSRLVERGEPG